MDVDGRRRLQGWSDHFRLRGRRMPKTSLSKYVSRFVPLDFQLHPDTQAGFPASAVLPSKMKDASANAATMPLQPL